MSMRDQIADLTATFTEFAQTLGVNTARGPVENHGLAHDPHKLELLLRAMDGPLALGALYLRLAQIDEHTEGWNVSCLPRWTGTPVACAR